MAPRSAKRLVSATKKPARKRKSPARSSAAKSKTTFRCYAIFDGVSLHFFTKHADAKELRDSHDPEEGVVINTISVSSSEELAKVLSDHTV